MGHPLVVEYYLFRNLQGLLHKDPGLFPERVCNMARARWPEVTAEIVDCFGAGKAFSALRSVYRRRSTPQLSIQFHLTLRTLIFTSLARFLGGNQKLVIKADLTAGCQPSTKDRAVWRMLDRLADLIVCETPEAAHLLLDAGVRRGVFVPNHLCDGDVSRAARPRTSADLRYDFLFVTAGDDPRKSPRLTEKTALRLVERGFRVVCVGLDRRSDDPNLVFHPRLNRPELFAVMRSSAVFVGLSRSESYWFLVAEAAALGVPACATPTGIAPYLAGRYEGLTLLDPAWRLSADRTAEFAAAHRSAVAVSYTPYDISGEARHRLQEALEAYVF